MLLILTACQHLEKELTFEHPAPRALEDTFINAPSVLQSGCSQVAIKILHGTDVSGWRKLHTDFKNSLWDKSISFPSTGPCLPPRKTEEKCCESMSFLEWVKKGLQPAVECRRWQKLCLDKAKILHELTGILTARKGCRWWSTVNGGRQLWINHTQLEGSLETWIQSTEHKATVLPHTVLSTQSACRTVQINTEHSATRWWKSGLGVSKFAGFLCNQTQSQRTATLGTPAKLPPSSDIFCPDSANVAG